MQFSSVSDWERKKKEAFFFPPKSAALTSPRGGKDERVTDRITGGHVAEESLLFCGFAGEKNTTFWKVFVKVREAWIPNNMMLGILTS